MEEKSPCAHCGELYTLRGIRLHELYCPKNPSSPKYKKDSQSSTKPLSTEPIPSEVQDLSVKDMSPEAQKILMEKLVEELESEEKVQGETPEVDAQPPPTLALDERLKLMWESTASNIARIVNLEERLAVAETGLSDYTNWLETMQTDLNEHLVQPKKKKPKTKTILYVTEEEARRLREKGKTVKK